MTLTLCGSNESLLKGIRRKLVGESRSKTSSRRAACANRHSVCHTRCLDCQFQILRVKAEWSGLALVEDAPALPDQVKSIGPAGISRLDPIVESVNQRGKSDAQLTHACAGNRGSLRLVLRAFEENAIFYVGLHLPHIGGMRLKDVNGVEADLVAILLGELVQGGNLPPKWRSGVASEDQHNWLACPERRQIGGGVVFELLHRESWRRIADV